MSQKNGPYIHIEVKQYPDELDAGVLQDIYVKRGDEVLIESRPFPVYLILKGIKVAKPVEHKGRVLPVSGTVKASSGGEM